MTLKKNILLVDDDAVANFLIEKVVLSTGLAGNIYKALNGREALHFFNGDPHTIRPEIILLDINMPIMNGYEFIQAFNQLDHKNNDMPLIIIVSSSSHPQDMKKAEVMGIKYYLTKPITKDKLKSILLSEFPEAA
jgi:CheY-like chemotaxis protein